MTTDPATNTRPAAPSSSRGAVIAVAVASLLAGSGATYAVVKGSNDTPAPAVTVTASPRGAARPTPSPTPADDANGFGQLLDARIAEQMTKGDRCVYARPGETPPTWARSALVENRPDGWKPTDSPVIVRVPAAQARHDAQGGLVLVHRWCAASK